MNQSKFEEEVARLLDDMITETLNDQGNKIAPDETLRSMRVVLEVIASIRKFLFENTQETLPASLDCAEFDAEVDQLLIKKPIDKTASLKIKNIVAAQVRLAMEEPFNNGKSKPSERPRGSRRRDVSQTQTEGNENVVIERYRRHIYAMWHSWNMTHTSLGVKRDVEKLKDLPKEFRERLRVNVFGFEAEAWSRQYSLTNPITARDLMNSTEKRYAAIALNKMFPKIKMSTCLRFYGI